MNILNALPAWIEANNPPQSVVSALHAAFGDTSVNGVYSARIG